MCYNGEAKIYYTKKLSRTFHKHIYWSPKLIRHGTHKQTHRYTDIQTAVDLDVSPEIKKAHL